MGACRRKSAARNGTPKIIVVEVSPNLMIDLIVRTTPPTEALLRS